MSDKRGFFEFFHNNKVLQVIIGALFVIFLLVKIFS